MRVNLGIDFGTSTTKICAREARGFGPELEVYPVSLSGDGELLCPSLVVIADGRVYYGEEARRRGEQVGAVAFPHLKSCLACQAEGSGHQLADCRSPRTGKEACEGRFEVGATAVRPSDLGACFLAWAFSRSRELMPEPLHGREGTDFTYHVGVPVGQLEQRSSLGELYRRMTWNAYNLSAQVVQGWNLESALVAIRRANELPFPLAGESPVLLSPEAGAAATSWLYAPETAPGVYGIVDVGAWTTDIAFFRRNDEELSSDNQVYIEFFSADSHRFAATEVDRRCRERLAASGSRAPSLSEVRTFREMRGGHRARPDWDAALHAARVEVADDIVRGFRKTIKQAQRKQWSAERWRGFPVFVVGGGVLEPELWKRIANEALPGRIAPAPSFAIAGVGEASVQRRLAIAVGLAIPQALWPRVYPPSEVEDDRRPRKRELPWSQDPGLD